nr:exosortase B [uncultured Duganella sp.]
MTNVAALHSVAAWKQRISAWWPVQLGLLILYLPTLHTLFTGIWTEEAYAHGPIILALSVWLLQRQWGGMQQAAAGQPPATRAGWTLVALALLLYIIGRSQDILLFEMSSFIVILAGLLLMVYGGAAFRQQWFPFFFMLFMVPLPGVIVDTVTMPMKMAVSYATEHLLFWAGYPIARTGVVLQIGQYQLMVADACAGLQTLLTLESLGLFYLNVVRHTSAFRNIALAILIIPISFTANVIRVIALTLITYYFGDAAGQGFLHGFAGMVLFVSALVLILSLDTFLQFIVSRRRPATREAA